MISVLCLYYDTGIIEDVDELDLAMERHRLNLKRDLPGMKTLLSHFSSFHCSGVDRGGAMAPCDLPSPIKSGRRIVKIILPSLSA